MPDSASAPVIAEAQVAEYRETGFVVVEDIYSAEEVAAMRAAIDAEVEDSRTVDTHTARFDLEPGHSREAPRLRRIKDPFETIPLFERMGRHPRLIAALTALLGPDIRMHGSKINLKSARFGSPVEWHQDWAFYPHTNDDVLAVGVMLDDMLEENGPLLCLPGSHRGPTYDHHQDGRFVGGIDPESSGIDFSIARPVLGRAGACSFHHVRMVHGSAPNTSGRDRRLLLYQVAAADAWDIRGFEPGIDWDGYVATMLAGEPTNQPRVVPTPIRLPFPGPEKTGSIYESQTVLRSKYFGAVEPKAAEGT